MTSNRTLAAFVAVGDIDTYPAGTCVAWMDSADRVCGKPGDYLCPRHVKVALRRMAQDLNKTRLEGERRATKRQLDRPGQQALLASIEAELDRIDPFRRDDTPDTAQVNVPLSRRLPSEARIERLANLHRQREHLRRLLRLPS